MKKILFLICFAAIVHQTQAQNELYNNGATIYISASANVRVNGSFTNTGTSPSFQNNGTLTITANTTNNQPMSGYTGKLIFNNTSAQTINGTADFLTKDLTINNAAGVTCNAKLKVDGVCTFTNGILTAGTSTTPLWFTANGTHTGASDASHVNGYAVKEGTGSFIYPVGNASNYEPVIVNASANNSGIQVLYLAADAGTASLSGGLLYYNTKEYWDITPLSTATGAVTINWDGYNNVGIGSTADLRVAHKTGGLWVNEGAVSVSGTVSAGSVTSNTISTWSPFSLGSVSTSSTLPLHWLTLSVVAGPQMKPVISWRVNENGVSRYEMEKSDDAQNFKYEGMVNSKGDGTNEYSYTECCPLQGTAWYRIKQIDDNGAVNYSVIQKITNLKTPLASLYAYPLPFKNSFTIVSYLDQQAYLTNTSGQLIQKIQLKNGSNYIDDSNFKSGVYLLTTESNYTLKIVRE